MRELLLRLAILLQILIPFVLFMASVYLALHVAVARLVGRPDSAVLWFFGVVTGPLVRPVRAWLPPGTPESRARLIALAVYVIGWLLSRALLGWLGQVLGR